MGEFFPPLTNHLNKSIIKNTLWETKQEKFGDRQNLF